MQSGGASRDSYAGGAPLPGPQRLGQLVAADWAVAIEGKIGKEDPPLASAQGVFEPPSLELNDESTAQLDAGRFPHDHGGQSIQDAGTIVTISGIDS